jgi:hypothetical protein
MTAHSVLVPTWTQLSSQSMGVLRFGPCDGAMTLPSGPITGSRSGRETLVSAAVAPGGGSSPPLRPQPVKPSAATTAPIAVIRARCMTDKKLNSDAPMGGTISGAGGNNLTKPPIPGVGPNDCCSEPVPVADANNLLIEAPCHPPGRHHTSVQTGSGLRRSHRRSAKSLASMMS